MIRYEKGIIPKYRDKPQVRNTIYTFDLESSNGFINESGKVRGYSRNRSEQFFRGNTAIAIMYIWQFSIDDMVFYGRTYQELVDFFDELNQKHKGKKIVYVHNLSHEFVFLNNIYQFQPQDVFARKPHKIIKASIPPFDIEFRCSYFLTNLSLENWGKKIGLPKAVGDLDYNKVRTPFTQLSEKELGYCERDCLVVYQGIHEFRKQYKHVKNIPLTQTGIVRKEYQHRIFNDKQLQKKLQRLVPTEEMYKILKKVFRGGDTHANYLHANKVIKFVKSFDISSSYPTVMLSEKFPMTPWIDDELNLEIDSHYAYILRIKIYDLDEKHPCHYIPKSKTEYIGNNDIYDNGRLVKADFVELYVTDVDLDIIQKSYNYTKIKVLEKYKSRKLKLPKELREFICELYANKTTLKGVKGFEEIYMQSKEKLNSLYGMCVTDIANQIIDFSNGEYDVTDENYQESVEPYFEKLHKNFLSYSWGIFVTAYARRNLWQAILAIWDDVVYYDTDSCKFIGEHNEFFEQYNKEIVEKLENNCGDLKGHYYAYDPKGKKHTLGVFEYEGEYSEFKTLGAKRYVYREKDGLHMTVSGVRKSAVSALKNDINNFKDGVFFGREISGKKIVNHSFTQPTNQHWVDCQGQEYVCNDSCGVNIRNSSYELGAEEYLIYLLSLV